MANLLRKISPKTVMGVKIKAPEKDTDLFTVYGIASKIRSGQSDYGEWTILLGQFEAVRESDGEKFVSPQCFLPEPMHSMVVSQLSGEDKAESVQFAIKVGIKPSDVAIGYEYTCASIVEPDEADALAALREQVVPALAAPETPKGKGKAA